MTGARSDRAELDVSLPGKISDTAYRPFTLSLARHGSRGKALLDMLRAEDPVFGRDAQEALKAPNCLNHRHWGDECTASHWNDDWAETSVGCKA